MENTDNPAEAIAALLLLMMDGDYADALIALGRADQAATESGHPQYVEINAQIRNALHAHEQKEQK